MPEELELAQLVGASNYRVVERRRRAVEVGAAGTRAAGAAADVARVGRGHDLDHVVEGGSRIGRGKGCRGVVGVKWGCVWAAMRSEEEI